MCVSGEVVVCPRLKVRVCWQFVRIESVVTRIGNVTEINSCMISSLQPLHLHGGGCNHAMYVASASAGGKNSPIFLISPSLFRPRLVYPWRCAPSVLKVTELDLSSRLATLVIVLTTSITSTMSFNRSPCDARFTVCFPECDESQKTD